MICLVVFCFVSGTYRRIRKDPIAHIMPNGKNPYTPNAFNNDTLVAATNVLPIIDINNIE